MSVGGTSSGVFVTGTGTEVGKTVVAAAIARTVSSWGRSVAVFKPAVSGLDDLHERQVAAERDRGCEDRHQESDHELLRRAADSTQNDDQIAPYRYGPPVSPHLGAELAGEQIEPSRLTAAACSAAESADFLVCEGVGGLLVPLTSTYSVRDLAVELGLPLVIAASPGLGTINHTLLTIEAARSSGLEIASVVLTPWPGKPSAIERSNRETISRIGAISVQGLPHLDLAEPETWVPLAPPLPEDRRPSIFPARK